MATYANDLHVVMLPWSAFGHMIPFYHLATALGKQGVRVSYLSTHRNIERLPKFPPQLAPLVQYISLPMPSVPEGTLPEGAEATIDMELDQIQYLKLAYDLLREPVKHFVSTCSPSWIISDFAAHWVPEIAKECRVPLMFFSIFGATLMSFLGSPESLIGEGCERARATPESWTTPPPWGEGVFPPSVALRSYEAAGLHGGIYGDNASGVTDAERMARMLKGCQAIGIRTCNEFEGEYINLFQKLLKKHVLPVGMLPTTAIDKLENDNDNWTEGFKWLDQQSLNSVIYVGFGSEYKLTKFEVHEVAYGLELAKLPFVWALRRPFWATDETEALPPGFMSRLSEKGIVCFGWSPQAKILAHPSIGGCLVHGGWGSIVETLQHGHNLVVLPFILDQGLNVRMLQEKGLGFEVGREEDGSYTRNHVANALRETMLGDDSRNIRSRAKHAAQLFFGDETSGNQQYIGTFVKYLRSRPGLDFDT